MSLRDSGVDVRVGRRAEEPCQGRGRGARWWRRTRHEEADLVVVLAPDPVQRHLYADAVEPNLVDGDALFFGHGFNIRFWYVKPPAGVDVCMVAPKGPGHLVRRVLGRSRRAGTCRGRAGRDRERVPLTLSYAKAIGGLRAGGIRTTFAEETETDLFGEQAVLCGGVSRLVRPVRDAD